ncbi:aminomethyltransferase beta-barrel domain-containing protein [Serinibacter salmoneus]|uniref:aminomethyltransferase beta-barrel domain-containing protein n=1 Tax=Serinibacter salmoneus TaxID=556530 RepID=UPI000BF259B2|nr:aminomethyltransferase beta-barrel domain-containing protein [Serinibacter salmoneus]
MLSVREVIADDVVWLAQDLPLEEWAAAQVQVRAHGDPLPAQVRRVAPAAEAGVDDGDAILVRLAEPLRGLASGQSLVVFGAGEPGAVDGADRVLGQGTVAVSGRGAAARIAELDQAREAVPAHA